MTMGIDYQRLYEYRFRDVDQVSRQAVWHEIAADIYRRMGAPKKVLDPAAGRCEFINAVPAAERWAVDTVDHNKFRHSDIKVIIADILDAELPPDYFDGVFVSNFLEHLPSQDVVGTVLAKLRDIDGTRWHAGRPRAELQVLRKRVFRLRRPHAGADARGGGRASVRGRLRSHRPSSRGSCPIPSAAGFPLLPR